MTRVWKRKIFILIQNIILGIVKKRLTSVWMRWILIRNGFNKCKSYY